MWLITMDTPLSLPLIGETFDFTIRNRTQVSWSIKRICLSIDPCQKQKKLQLGAFSCINKIKFINRDKL